MKQLCLILMAFFLGSCDPSAGDASLFFSSSMPIVVIDSDGNNVEQRPFEKLSGTARVYLPDPDSGVAHTGERHGGYKGKVKFKVRGNTSVWFAKRNFSLDIKSSKDNDRFALAGLPVGERWVLHGPYSDKSLLRNYLSYKLAEAVSSGFVPKTRFVELFLHGSYRGIYLLTEKIEVAGGKVRFGERQDSEGFLMKVDDVDFGDVVVRSDRLNLKYIVSYPKADEISPLVLADVKENYLDRVEDVLAQIESGTPCSYFREQGIDMDSFIEQFLIHEIAFNPDGLRKSQYLYFGRHQPIAFGPPWDYNLAMGNYKLRNGDAPDPQQVSLWSERRGLGKWLVLFQQSQCFVDQVNEAYARLRREVVGDGFFTKLIDAFTGKHAAAIERNYQRWKVLGRQLPFNPIATVAPDYSGEVANLKSWLAKRLIHLDQHTYTTTQ